ncbi:MAG TPA: tripartite tricarboxylate transporter substrate binding protein [Reyranella sp.]|nr:tripartite tricarboxylate transporter substrate binding protein [Reyranella sp.]
MSAWAEFPDRPITIQAPYAPGGNIDVTARIIADKLKDVLGITVLVDNRAGASGMIGSASVARSAPDGYTLLVSANSMVDVPVIYGNAPYDWHTAFQPISAIQSVPGVIVVNPNSPIHTLAELIKAGRDTPGKVTIGDSGVGTTNHIVLEMLSDATKAKFTIVHYKGGGQASIDVIAGQVTGQVDQLNASIGHIRAGKLRALAVTSDARVPELPDVPTVKESGVPELKDFTYNTITGLFGPARMPPEVLKKLNEAMVKVLRDPATIKRFADLTATARPSTPEELAAMFDHEDKTAVPLIKKLGIKSE